MKQIVTILSILILSFNCLANDIEQKDTLLKNTINVYYNADDYIKKEISFINYVRDLKDADVYILTTKQPTGSGGNEYTFFFVGQNRFQSISDTLTFTTKEDDPLDIIRNKKLIYLKLGLIQYFSRTPLAEYFDVNFNLPFKTEDITDKWKNWVFKTNVRGFFSGQKTYSTSDIYNSFSASKVTKEWKFRFNVNANYHSQKFNIDDRKIKSVNDSKSAYIVYVKSLSEHWSYGGIVCFETSTYKNLKSLFEVLPSIEYDIYPYSQSTRRQLRLLYSLGIYSYNYLDTTIYNKISENLFGHSLSAAYEVIQKWGSVECSAIWKNYFHDWSKNRFSLDGYINYRITKGLTMNIGNTFSIIHDQISLSNVGASEEEILLRKKEMETNFSYFFHFGLTYTFGSLFNNVVNPRFGDL